MIKKDLQLCGLGNGLVDVLTTISDADFSKLGLERGSEQLVDEAAQNALLEKLKAHKFSLISGGSVANSVALFSRLGGKAALLTCIGDDRYGLHFKDEFERDGIELGSAPHFNHNTGTCVCLVTPDSERTMHVSLGAASKFSLDDVNEELIGRSEWLFIEGYVFGNPNGPASINQAVKFARQYRTKIALTFSESWVIAGFGDAVRDVIGQCDLVLANEKEAMTFSGKGDGDAAFAAMADSLPGVAVTLGPEGARLSYNGEQAVIEAFPCDPVDLTGAGDAFAGGLLFGLNSGFPLAKAGSLGCRLATEVIIRVGARLEGDVKRYLAEARS